MSRPQREDLELIKQKYDALNPKLEANIPYGYDISDCWVRRFMDFDDFIENGPIQKRVFLEDRDEDRMRLRNIYPKLYDLIMEVF